MTRAYLAPILSAALEQFKEIVKSHAECGGREGTPLIVFCEDRLSLVAERAVCEAVGGTFSVEIYTLSRFLTSEGGACDMLLTSQGSAMAIKKLIENNRDKLELFKMLSTPDAAQNVYDTIALLYSSKISPDDLDSAKAENNLLSRKLHDLRLLYGEYMNYLEASGAVDRNVYLRRLPDIIRYSEKIRNADVLYFGFQAFTSSVADCVRASFETAKSVSGIFIGGTQKKYVNEGVASFLNIAGEFGFKAGVCQTVKSGLCPAAEAMRKYAFETESYLGVETCEAANGEVNIFEAADISEECEFIAAEVLKRVTEDKVRYREISVMLPDVNLYQPVLERAFTECGVPMYADRRYPLSSHSICSFICDYLSCAADGCLFDSVQAVVLSPMFGVWDNARSDTDQFINYMLRAGSYRGAVRRGVNKDICSQEKYDFAAVERVRETFMKGYTLVEKLNGKDGAVICEALKKLLEVTGAEARLKELSELSADFGFAAQAEMSARAFDATMLVLDEAEKLTACEKISLREFIKILKSGFTAAEISLIPPKQDAVFVGDLAKCANTGSKVLFVAGLTEAVPASSQDTAILTDGELVSLEKIKMAVSPKISQVNARVRETTALNLCAFSQSLYLIYPLKNGGEECGRSEAITYAKNIFTSGGKPIEAVTVRDAAKSKERFAYFNAQPQTALRSVLLYPQSAYSATVVSHYLKEGVEFEARSDEGRFEPFDRTSLYVRGISPTALETYYSCPYKAFMQQGLKLRERREGTLRPLDSGNFIHTVLEKVAVKINGIETADECAAEAGKIAEELLKSPAYTVSDGDGGAAYSAEKLKEEAVTYSLAMFDQLKNSSFTVEGTEKWCQKDINGVTVFGKIDRVDSCGDMVRVIDYKTGTVDDNADSYYMGLKLQLPLYLSAVSDGRRAAGAYYFPANSEYSPEGGSFTLKGFMDGSEDVVRSSDLTVKESERSKLVGAYLNGRSLDKAMSKEDFPYFIAYSEEVAKAGAKELTRGTVAPSPVEKACDYCPFGGSCGYDKDGKGERRKVKANCADIVKVMRGGDGGAL